jgi:uncharacterized protein (TIGR02246 family)
MRTIFTVLACSVFFLTSLFALDPSDQASITRVLLEMANAWNTQEGYGFADGYAEDADFINIYAMHFSGKKEIEERHVKILQTFMKGSKFEVMDVKLREIQPGVVVALEHWKVAGFHSPNSDMNGPGEVRQGTFTHVFLKKVNQWEIVASQNTLAPLAR